LNIKFVIGSQYFKVKQKNKRETKLSCDSRFQREFNACSFVFKGIARVGSNQGNYFENETACSKRKLKTRVATQLKQINQNLKSKNICSSSLKILIC